MHATVDIRYHEATVAGYGKNVPESNFEAGFKFEFEARWLRRCWVVLRAQANMTTEPPVSATRIDSELCPDGTGTGTQTRAVTVFQRPRWHFSSNFNFYPDLWYFSRSELMPAMVAFTRCMIRLWSAGSISPPNAWLILSCQ
jgi:hypothetical protein